MRKYNIIILLSLCCLIISCEKQEDNEIVINDLTGELEKDIHFDVYNCYKSDFDTIYKTIDEFYDDSCLDRIPVPIGFEGIVLMQFVQVPYLGEDGSAYNQEVNIRVSRELKKVYFDYVLTTIDTSRRYDKLVHSSLVLLDGYDSTYQVIFNHEIIPFQE